MNKKWLYLILGFLINLCIGAVFSWSVFRQPLEEYFTANATQSGFPYLLSLAFFAISMPFTGKLLDKIGLRNSIILGGFLVGIGWIVSSYATSINLLYWSYGVLVGIGVGITYSVPITMAAKWFPNKKGLATGFVLSGFGFSAVITAPLAVELIQQYNLLSAFKIYGIAFMVILLLLAIPLKIPELDVKSPELKGHTSKDLFRDKRFYVLWICFTIATFVGLMSIGISSPIGIDLIGLTPFKAASFVSFFAIFNGVSRPFFGWLVDKIGPKRTVIFSYFLIIIASLLIIMSKEGSQNLFLISFSIFWFCLGGWLAIAPATTALFFGEKNYSTNYGYLYTAYGVGAVLGTLSSGIIKDTFGSYVYIFYPIIGLAVVGIILSMIFFKVEENSFFNTNRN